MTHDKDFFLIIIIGSSVCEKDGLSQYIHLKC